MEDKNELSQPTYSIIGFPSNSIPKTYIPLIFSRWLRSLKQSNPLFRKMTSREFYTNYHKFIEKLLAVDTSYTRLAVLSDDHDIVLGFCVTRGADTKLDFVHVHSYYRRNGVAKALVPSNVITFTHLTDVGMLIWQEKKQDEWTFNPFA